MSTDRRVDVSTALVNDAVQCANAFRRRALQACAATVLAAEPFGDEATARAALEGRVSDRVMKRIVELLSADAEASKASVVQQLMSVTCIGRVAALRLAALGVGSLDALASRIDDPELALTPAQKLCVEHRHDIAARIPRAEMNRHAAVIEEAAVQAAVEVHVVGSYRRNADSSGDVDVLLVGDMDSLLAPLFAGGYVVGTIARGGCKFNGIVRLPGADVARRLDVLRTTPEELPFAMLHFTGPDVYNMALRRVAIAAGKRLSEKGWGSVRPDSAPPKTEAEVLHALGVEYQLPQDRCATLTLLRPSPP